MARIFVIGSANMDVVAPLRRMPGPGETILIDDVTLVSGGKGANAAVAAARLGASVRFVGCVGDDAFGRIIRANLMREGIDCSNLRVVSRGTGTAIILLDRNGGQNAIMVGAGANHELTLPPLEYLFDQTDALMLQLETPIHVNLLAMRQARAARRLIVLDPAPASTDLPRELLRDADLVSPNESELAILAGRPVHTVDDAIDAGARLLAAGVRELVIKLGDKGALWMSPRSRRLFPAVKVTAVDTTAAGDVFTAALTAGLAGGMEMPAAIERACLAGALTCTRMGAQSSIPTAAELDTWAHGASKTRE